MTTPGSRSARSVWVVITSIPPSVPDGHRVQCGVVGTGLGQPRQPVLLVAERPVDLFDAAVVFGGHVE